MNDPLLQPPLQNDARMEALARLIARLSVLPTERPLVNLADTVAASALSALGEQFHIMGDEGWNYARTEAERSSRKPSNFIDIKARRGPCARPLILLLAPSRHASKNGSLTEGSRIASAFF